MTEKQIKRLLVLLGAICLAYFVIGLVNGFFQNKRVLRRYAEVQKVYAQQTALNKDLKAKLEQVHEDTFIELTARDKLGLVKPGEIAYKIIEE